MQEQLKRILDEDCSEITGDRSRRKTDNNNIASDSNLSELNDISVTVNRNDGLTRQEESDGARYQGSLDLVPDQREVLRPHDIVDEAVQGEVPLPVASGLLERERQNLLYGQLTPSDKKRSYKLYLSSGHCFSWKQPKQLYQRLKEIEELSREQKQLALLVRNKLLLAFAECLSIADGKCFDVSCVDSSTTLDMVQHAGAAGGLLPFIGPAIVAADLALGALRIGLREFNKSSVISRSKLVKEFVSDPDDMMTLSNNVAIIVAIIYGEPISQLSQDGLTVFANCLVNRMIHYVATDNGRNSTYLNSICNVIINKFYEFYNDLLNSYDPSHASPYRDKVMQPRERILLDSILCYSPISTAPTSLERKPEYRTHEIYTIEGILSTGIRTPEGVRYENANTNAGKYGYRFLSREYAEKMGYTRIGDNYVNRLLKQ